MLAKRGPIDARKPRTVIETPSSWEDGEPSARRSRDIKRESRYAGGARRGIDQLILEDPVCAAIDHHVDAQANSR
jgi:hypothetical protein